MRTRVLALRLLLLWGWVRIRLALRIRTSKRLWRRWYNLLSELTAAIFGELRFMNYGYLPAGEQPRPEDGPDACQVAMVRLCASAGGRLDLAGKRVLEVGCGRGGGAAWMARRWPSADIHAVDLSEANVAACKQQFGELPNLHFAVGDAEHLPFERERFDVVVNVESSHCYPDYPAFLAEVERVLVPGGTLSSVDFRLHDRLAAWERDVAEGPLDTLARVDITDDVVRALEADHPRKVATIAASGAPRAMQPVLQGFTGCIGSEIHRSFVKRERVYLHYVLRKR